jgi:hypothetical protein
LPELICDGHEHSPVPRPNRSMRSLAVTDCSKLLTWITRPGSLANQLSRKLLSALDRLGCLSFRNALASARMYPPAPRNPRRSVEVHGGAAGKPIGSRCPLLGSVSDAGRGGGAPRALAAASESVQGRKPRRGKGMAAGRKPGVPFSEEEHYFCWPPCPGFWFGCWVC